MKNFLMKGAVFILAVSCCLSLSACGGQKQEIESTFTGLMEALRAVDLEKAGDFIDTGELNVSETVGVGGGDQVLEAVFSQLDYEIISTEITDGDAALVTAEITTIDLTAILGQSTMTVLQELAMGQITEEDIDARTEEIFKEAIKTDNLQTASNQAQITLKKTDNGWKVVANQELQNAISGGFLGAVNNAQSALFNSFSAD